MKAKDSHEESDFSKEQLPEGVVLKEHSYDGIREYDQRLPRWWLLTLYGAIAFSAVYWFILDVKSYTGGDNEALEKQLVAIQTAKLSNSIDVTDNGLFFEMSGNPDFVASGSQIYQSNCAACHGKELQGGIGFSLVDDEWVHGSQPSDIYLVISEGVPEKGMQAWENQLGQKKIAQVVAFILSQNPGLQPEG